MAARRDPSVRSGCPISLSLEIFGDRWSLLIVRDIMFKGRSTFRDFADGGEGIATNVLADRLVRLETAGLIDRQQDPRDGRRVTYRLTPKGWDLAPMIVELVIWAARHEDTEAPPATIRQMRANRARFIAELKKQRSR